MRGNWIWAAALLAGCSFRTEVPGTARVACHAEGDACPEGMRCRPAIGRCVPEAELAQAPVGVVGGDVEPKTGGLQSSFTLTFQVTQPLARAPVAYATAFHLGAGASVEAFPFACGDCAPGADCRCTWAPDPAHHPPEGAVQVQVEVVDQHGNAPPPFAAGTLQLDLSPPRVVGAAAVALTPPGGVPVTALGPGVGAEVCFEVDEPLGAPPTLRAEAEGGGRLDFAHQADSSDTRPCFTAALGDAAGLPDGPLRLVAGLADAVGNAGEREVPLSPALEVRAAPPPAPDLEADGGLRYHRAPWGQGGDDRPSYRLESDGQALAASGWLVVYADPAGEVELGRAAVTPGALPALPFPGPDRPQVWVDLFGPGGVAASAAPLPVRNVEWVATLGRKRAGDAQANPHRCVARPVQWPALEAPGDFGEELGGAAFADGGSVKVGGGASWARRGPPVTDGVGSAFAFDARRGLAVGYGATFGPAPTLEFNGRAWGQLEDSRTSRLSARGDPALAYSPGEGAVVLFGGLDVGQAEFAADTWAWGGAGWRRLDDGAPDALPDGGVAWLSRPGPRRYAQLGYDAERQRLLLVGGEQARGIYRTYVADQWEWDGAGWRRLASHGLPPHHSGSLAYQPADGGGYFVLVGGFESVDGGSDSTRQSTDTWVGQWDGQAYAWGKVTAGGASPAFTSFAAYDPEQGLAAADSPGAFTANTGDVNLFRWQGRAAGWQKVATRTGPDRLEGLTPAPGGGFWAFVVGPDGLHTYRCLLSGPAGCEDVSRPWDAVSARSKGAMAFGGGGALYYGGEALDANADTVSLAEGQRWDGEAWRSVPAAPGRRHNATMAWSEPDQGFWLAGGDRWVDAFDVDPLGDAWLYADGGWTSLGSLPAMGGYSFGLAALPDGGMLASQEFGPTVVLGRDASGQINPLAQLSADGRPGPLAFDPVAGVLYGNDLGQVGALTLGSGTWRDLTGVPSTGASLIFDPASQSTLLVGPTNLERGAVWRLVGNGVETIPAGDPEADGAPPLVDQPGVAADPRSGTVLLVGGQLTSGDYNAETWEYALARVRPAGVCAFEFGAAQAPAGAEVRALRLTALAGAGRRAPGAADQPEGAVVQLWRGGRWADAATLATTAQDLDHPAPVTFETSDPAELRDLLADRQTLGLAVVPAQPNGAGLTSVRLGGPELVVDYRLP